MLSIRDALSKAEEAGLDLVEVAPGAKPPVCKILDYGKFKYKEQKKEAEARKNRSETTTKELRLRYRTDVGDLAVKLKRAREFLAEGDKVKFVMRFKGREAMYLDLGKEKLDEIQQSFRWSSWPERSCRSANDASIGCILADAECPMPRVC